MKRIYDTFDALLVISHCITFSLFRLSQCRVATWIRWGVKFIPPHVLFIAKSNSENCIKIRWFFTKLRTKISWLLCTVRGVYIICPKFLCSVSLFRLLYTGRRSRTDGRTDGRVFTVLASLQRGVVIGGPGLADRRAGLASGRTCRSARRLAGHKSLCNRRDNTRVKSRNINWQQRTQLDSSDIHYDDHFVHWHSAVFRFSIMP